MARISVDDELVARKARLAQIGAFGGTLLLVAGLALYFLEIYGVFGFQVSGLLGLSLALLVVGFVMGSVGNRGLTLWVHQPRADQLLARAAKGWDDRHRLYSYLLPADHVLLAPHGLYVILAKAVDGRVTSVGDRWRRNLSLLRLLRGFGPAPLGNPTKELKKQVRALRGLLSAVETETDPQGEAGEIHGLVVFTHPQIYLEVQNPSVPVMPLRSLKSYMRKQARQQSLSDQLYQEWLKILDGAAAA
ncbi:MAG: nuclease-related domain-containing protein [Anaerolineae bacterium]